MEENKTNQEAKEEELKNALSILDTNPVPAIPMIENRNIHTLIGW